MKIDVGLRRQENHYPNWSAEYDPRSSSFITYKLTANQLQKASVMAGNLLKYPAASEHHTTDNYIVTMPLTEALALFDDAIFGEVAETTRLWYLTLLQSFVAFYGAAFAVEEINPVSLRRWRRYVYREHENISTRNSYIRAAKRFFNWLVAEGYIDTSPAENIRCSKRGRQQPRHISLEDFQRLVNHFTARRKLRDLAIVYFLLSTGCRLSGLLGLRLCDIDGAQAWVVEKGGKGRWVFLVPSALDALCNYIDHARPPVPYEQVFISNRRRPMVAMSVQGMLKRAGKAAGCTGPVNPHSFRHGAAVAWLQAGMSLSAVSRLLGHADIKTTHDYYAYWEQNTLQEQHEKYMRRVLKNIA